MAQYDKSKANPDLIGNFVLVRNKQKTEAKHPDLVHPDSTDENGNVKMNKAGKPFKKNFTVNGIWCEASGYIQEDKSIKIRILKTSSEDNKAAAPKAAPMADAWDNQF
jgi:hypothetical protein